MKSNNEKLTEIYVAPEMRLIELSIEGMICLSNPDGTFTVDGLSEGSGNWWEDEE